MSETGKSTATLEELAIAELASELREVTDELREIIVEKEKLNKKIAKIMSNSEEYKISKISGEYTDEVTIVFKKKTKDDEAPLWYTARRSQK